MRRPIVVGVTVAQTDTNRAVEWAATEAARRQAPLRLVHSVGRLLQTLAGAPQRLRDRPGDAGAGRPRSSRRTRRLPQAPDVRVETAMDVDTSPSTTLLAEAAEAECWSSAPMERTAW